MSDARTARFDTGSASSDATRSEPDADDHSMDASTPTDIEPSDPDAQPVPMDMMLDAPTCETMCAAVTDCLIAECTGFGPNMRRQINNRCRTICTPELVEQLDGLSCEITVDVIAESIPQVANACQSIAPGEAPKTLYIGHSFGRPFAARMEQWTANAGIMGHTQGVVFSGGASGAPQALWDHPQKSLAIKGILDSGEVETLIMICCSMRFLEDGTDPAIRLWMDYALEHNPNTRFVLALPWPDFPEDYDTVELYAELWNEGRALWGVLIDQLRADYPGVPVTALPHGRAALELRALFEAGELNDVDSMTRAGGPGIFTDRKGHADRILLDLGSLVWVGALYDVDLTGYPLAIDYEIDLIDLAQMILAEDDQVRQLD